MPYKKQAKPGAASVTQGLERENKTKQNKTKTKQNKTNKKTKTNN